MNLQIGSIIRDLEIISLLGAGGMSEVHLAKDNLDRLFAIKILAANLTRDPTFQERFRQEAKIMASLHHPNIVQLHSYFELDDLYCLVMEYIEGGSLKDLIRQTGPIPEERALHIFNQIAEALAYAHEKEIVHRDIKPSNIMFDKDGTVKVMDFGIARMKEGPGLTRTGTQMGTLVYMSPEQIRDSKHIDSKSDVYSLGVTLYEMLTGQSPYDENTESDYDIRVNIVNKDIPDPTLIYPHISESTVLTLKSLTQKEKQIRPEAIQISIISSGTYPGVKNSFDRHSTVNNAEITCISLDVLESSQSNSCISGHIESKLVNVQGGTYRMGNGLSDSTFDEKPAHDVLINSFLISKYQITQAQWLSVMGINPSRFIGENLPVEQISWYEAIQFCNKLSEQDGLIPCYDIDGINTSCNWNANGYRLPTEAEWEYAARGGNGSKGYKYSGSNYLGLVAWYEVNSDSMTHAIGQKQPNELGLYDMSGNVWEWCWDWYDSSYYANSPRANPRCTISGSSRVLRGGSWYGIDTFCRVTDRISSAPDNCSSYMGARIARSLV